jgi:uncharacterized protein
MKVSMHAVSADLITNILGNLSWLLQKGEANAASRKFDPAVLLSARLAPDMLPLTRQIQIAGDIAKNSLARLAGQEPPRFEDNETTIEQLRARLARTIDYIKSIPASAFEGSETRDIKVPAGERTLEFKGLDFLQTWVIPHVFFHVTTAYNILRHNGVDLGKADFIGGGRKL